MGSPHGRLYVAERFHSWGSGGVGFWAPLFSIRPSERAEPVERAVKKYKADRRRRARRYRVVEYLRREGKE